jgi:hypothetical protein
VNAAESAALQRAYDEWVAYWLAREGEPDLKPPSEYFGHGTEGEGQYNQFALLVDATPEQQDDLDRRQAAALAALDAGATMPGREGG